MLKNKIVFHAKKEIIQDCRIMEANKICIMTKTKL